MDLHLLPPMGIVRRRFRALARLAAISFCLLSTAGVRAEETHCVGDAAELTTALANAATNSTNDYIYIRRGTYLGNFAFSSDQDWPITILGGYDPGCTTRTDDPSTTILDGQGHGTVLSIYQGAGGGVTVQGLTLQNGGWLGLWVRLLNELAENSIGSITLVDTVIRNNRGVGGAVLMSEPGQAVAGPILISDNAILGNFGDRGGFRLLADWDLQGNWIVFVNNLVVGNISNDTCGGIDILASNLGEVFLTNNTIVDNESLFHTARPGGLDASIGTAFHAYNNIIWGNRAADGPADLNVWYSGPSATGEAFNNDYGDMGGSWHAEGANLDADPEFVGRGYWHDNGTVGDPSDDFWMPGDYHLTPDSPCIDVGSHDAPSSGAIPSKDFEGDPRVVDGDGDRVPVIDIGADENTVIFADGFESGGTTAWSSG